MTVSIYENVGRNIDTPKRFKAHVTWNVEGKPLHYFQKSQIEVALVSEHAKQWSGTIQSTVCTVSTTIIGTHSDGIHVSVLFLKAVNFLEATCPQQ